MGQVYMLISVNLLSTASKLVFDTAEFLVSQLNQPDLNILTGWACLSHQRFYLTDTLLTLGYNNIYRVVEMERG